MYPEYADADIAFNFREFFRVDREGKFIHEMNIRQFLDLLTKKDADSIYPYSKEEYRQNFRHSLWMVPGVKEAKALSKLLQAHPIFGHFSIANVAGDGDEEEEERGALEKVRRAIGTKPEETYSITLSCGRLTTGVSVEPWTACFMLAGSFSTSASAYMQTIFRVQTPAVIGGKRKDECFVFDFAPDRTLKVIAETAKISSKAGKTTQTDREILGEFLNFCPVIGFDGSRMKAYDTEKMLGQLKRVYVERVVRNGFEDNYLYSDELFHMDKTALEEFADLKRIIGSTKAQGKMGDINVNAQGLTDEQYELLQDRSLGIREKPAKELTPEQKEALAREEEINKNRESAISILRGISVRMPLAMYALDLQLNLDGTEDAITIDNLTDLIDDPSWEEFMPKGVTKEIFRKFKKYYDPDVFRESGMKIRRMVRAADKLCIEDRIERISSIFGTFRNPDKETVLTPWRVVNMHLSQSLGGWRFYDKGFNTQLAAPEFVDLEGITENVFKKDARILEMNSKTGLYALYCTYSIYRTRAKFELGPNPSREAEANLWSRVLRENIFLICKTSMAKRIAQRTLAGFADVKANAHYFEDLIGQLKNKPENFISKVRKASYWKKGGEEDMKFDAIVGNPPYQVAANGNANGSDPIYHLFIDVSCKLGDKVSLIHPARFLFNAGKTPKDWNEKMLNDEHYKVIGYWANSMDLFPAVDIKGGVAITYWDKNKVFGKIGAFASYPELNGIKDKAAPMSSEGSLMSIMYNQTNFDLEILLEEHPECIKGIGSDGKDRRLEKNIFDKILLFTEGMVNNDDIKILGVIKNKRNYRFIPRKYLDISHENLMKYKVLVPRSNGSGAIGEVLSTPMVGEPMVGYTRTFLGIGAFDTKAEAENALKYVKTKFARVMLGILKITQDNPIETWRLVPLQDFTENSDIDWNKSVPDIDKQLYEKYGLSDDEIAFIESKVKGM